MSSAVPPAGSAVPCRSTWGLPHRRLGYWTTKDAGARTTRPYVPCQQQPFSCRKAGPTSRSVDGQTRCPVGNRKTAGNEVQSTKPAPVLNLEGRDAAGPPEQQVEVLPIATEVQVHRLAQ